MKKLLVLALALGFPIAGSAACSDDDDHCHEEPCTPGGAAGAGGAAGTTGSGGTAGSSDATAD